MLTFFWNLWMAPTTTSIMPHQLLAIIVLILSIFKSHDQHTLSFIFICDSCRLLIALRRMHITNLTGHSTSKAVPGLLITSYDGYTLHDRIMRLFTHRPLLLLLGDCLDARWRWSVARIEPVIQAHDTNALPNWLAGFKVVINNIIWTWSIVILRPFQFYLVADHHLSFIEASSTFSKWPNGLSSTL